MLIGKNIHKMYHHPGGRLKDVHVLKGVTIDIQKGEVVAIVGPSGAGKSTLLHILGGLDKPTQGEVLLDQEDLYRLKDGQRAAVRNERVGFIFQFYHLLPEFSALENVVLPALVKADAGMDAGMRKIGMELLESVGLSGRATHKPNELSGGEQQRVAIARAAVNQPDILLCDEPTGNLDSEHGVGIIELLMKMNRDKGQTLVIVTHDEEIASRAGRVMYLKDGKIIK